ncbi:MAG TPA: 16S rRNA (adenine(1518)-N(6)/adenine(1519)-N(6))-dimethyltransferase RsmA [Longimicrobiales bacterium]|nr:16S rRNA (adenine(1518)-N(6)/adenine(1519)-N(6))-dimethyltransferase RsmA [Longimicrobiales bacterium]
MPANDRARIIRGMTERRPAKRSLGQNFLVDEKLQRKIVGALGAPPSAEVLEIGPGRGALTRHLAGAVRRLLLVELDDDLAHDLAERYAGRTDVAVVHADVLDVDLAGLSEDPAELLVVGNIPYNITTPIVFRLLERPRPRQIVLMVQDDVANRIVGPVGTKAYGALSVGVRTVAEVERLFKVGRGAFRPVPGVDSAVIRIRPFRPERLSLEHEQALRRLVRAAFQWRRKQLRKILRDHPDLAYPREVAEAAATAAAIDLDERPERVTPEQFVTLATALP